jgi:hypothetical protein
VKVKSLIPDIVPPPDFENRLLAEIDRDNFGAEIRALRLQGNLALAAATPKPKPRRRPSGKRPSVRLRDYASMIGKAARKAGTSVRKFCEILDQERVPVLPSWGVRTAIRPWTAAYNRPELRTRIRGVKHRLCPAA